MTTVHDGGNQAIYVRTGRDFFELTTQRNKSATCSGALRPRHR